jgi:bifunctional DNA-binding transcriptional regulator/antitoxin component of YhaV-PrlF toxin-antitoxin module
MMNKSWTLPVEEVKDVDTDEIDYFITLPQDMLEQTGWIEGDILAWIDNGDGSFTMKKQEVTEVGDV